MMTTIHPNELPLEKLKEIRTQLFSEESTDENVQKLKAIEKQIGRHEAFKEEQKAAAKAATEKAKKAKPLAKPADNRRH